ncbi:uncharacterized protein [Dysidea avara]|uniref:uncharacterized protein n=1 Tax=Dysidea avara TaxID=196820 RepID=UPI00331C4499
MERMVKLYSFFARTFRVQSRRSNNWEPLEDEILTVEPIKNLLFNGKYCQATQEKSLAIVKANLQSALPYNHTCEFTYIQKPQQLFQLKNNGIEGFLAIQVTGETPVVVVDPSLDGNNTFKWDTGSDGGHLFEVNSKMYITLDKDLSLVPTSSPPQYTGQLVNPIQSG